jgi:hypothetical protein
MKQFKITRADGRSNAEVILDLIKDAEPGRTFSYDECLAALSEGTDTVYSSRDVQRIVTSAVPRMLKEQARVLHNVRNVGYRLAPGGHHLTLANERKQKADKQMLRGLLTLQHVRWEEMSPEQRLAHEGQLLISGALYQQMQALERRQGNIEAAVRDAIRKKE